MEQVLKINDKDVVISLPTPHSFITTNLYTSICGPIEDSYIFGANFTNTIYTAKTLYTNEPEPELKITRVREFISERIGSKDEHGVMRPVFYKY